MNAPECYVLVDSKRFVSDNTLRTFLNTAQKGGLCMYE